MSKDFRGASGQEQSCELSRIKSPAISRNSPRVGLLL